MVCSMDIAELKTMSISELTKLAKELEVNGVSGLKKQDLIFRLLQAKTEKEGSSSAKVFSRSYPTGSGS